MAPISRPMGGFYLIDIRVYGALMGMIPPSSVTVCVVTISMELLPGSSAMDAVHVLASPVIVSQLSSGNNS